MGTTVDASAVVVEEVVLEVERAHSVPISWNTLDSPILVPEIFYVQRSNLARRMEVRTMIDNMIKEGKIVPSEVTIKLLKEAMIKSENDKFLIDGFPRNEENCAAFENVTKISPAFVLFFDCAEEEMKRRLLGRNQGRVDDNIETIRKRFKVFVECSLPVIEYYSSKDKVKKIDAAKPIPEVFEDVKAIFAPYSPKAEAE